MRCNIHFTEDGKLIANVYSHFDGNPLAIRQRMQEFFLTLKEEEPYAPHLFNAASLSAKFVVWQGVEWSSRNHKLDFIGLELGVEDHPQTEAIYQVQCDNKEKQPLIRWRFKDETKWRLGLDHDCYTESM